MSTTGALANENRQLRKELARLVEQARENQEILRRYQELDLQLIGAGSFRELADALFHHFARDARLDAVTIALLDPDYEIQRILIELQINLNELPQLLFVQHEAEFGELRSRLDRPLLSAYSEQLHGQLFPEPLPAPASVALLPLRRQQRLIGCLNLGSADPLRFRAGMGTDIIEHMAAIAALCLENVISSERLKHIGLTDPLTGIHNRRYVERRLLEEIGRSRRHGCSLSCMYIDIDHFKQINDSVGHQAGDEVLRAVAARVKAELRLSDALGRFGGEEFVALLVDADAAEAAGVAERVRASIAEQELVLASGKRLAITVSVGVAGLQRAEPGETAEDAARRFLAQADRALYQAKDSGRNRVVNADAFMP